MDREVKVRYAVDDDTSTGTNSVVRNIRRVNGVIQNDVTKTSKTYTQNGQKIVDINEQINKSVVKVSDKGGSALADFGKKMVALYLTAEVAKQAFNFFADAVKQFDKQSNGDAVRDLTKAFGQLQVEIGSILYPELLKFTKWVKENKVQIAIWAQGVTNIVIGLGKALIGSIRVITNSGKLLVLGYFDLATSVYTKALELINRAVQHLPVGDKIKKAIGDTYSFMSDVQKGFREDALKTTEALGKSYKQVGEGAKQVGKGISDIAKGIKNTTNVKFISDEQKAALKTLQGVMKTHYEWRLNTVRKIESQINSITMSAYEYAVYQLEEQGAVLLEQAKKNDEMLIKAAKEYDKAVSAKDKLNASDKLRSIRETNAAYAEYVLVATAKLERDKTALELEARRLNNAFAEEQLKYEYGLRLAARETDIQALNDYYDYALQIAKVNEDDMTSLIKSATRDRSKVVAALRKELESGGAGSSRMSSEQAATNELEKEVERRTKIYSDMDASQEFSEEELSDYRIGLEEYTADQLKAIDQDLLDTKMANIESQVSMYAGMASMVVDIGANMVQAQMNNLDREKQERVSAVNDAFDKESKYTKDSTKLAKARQNALDKIDEDNEKKQDALRKKAQGWAIAGAVISGAEATMSAWVSAMKMGYPQNIIVGTVMTSLIAALTATQIGVITSQKFAGGGIATGPESGDMVNAQVNGGEMVLTKAQQYNLWANANSRGSGGLSVEGDTIIVQGNMDQNSIDQIRGMKEQRMATLQSDIKELSYRNRLQLS